MSNVISLMRAQGLPEMGFGPDALVLGVSTHRRSQEDLRWLKENAEILRCLVASGVKLSTETLETSYAAFLADLPSRLAFFPQYYRFFLHMALDLAALGLRGHALEDLAHLALRSGAPQAELSDLQRAEKNWLLSRAGIDPGPESASVAQRLADFVSQPQTFALPNRKAGYEVTHLAFYLTDFGRRRDAIPQGLCASIRNVGIVSWLEQNLDLLAECCIALDYIGADVPKIWTDRLADALPAYRLRPLMPEASQDDYHAWLMVLWSQMNRKPEALARPYPSEGFTVIAPPAETGALRALSRILLSRAPRGSHCWPALKDELVSGYGAEAAAVVDHAARALPEFPIFFEEFARYNLRMSVA